MRNLEILLRELYQLGSSTNKKQLRIQYKQFPHLLESLQDMWENNEVDKHIETTTIVLSQFAFSPGITAKHLLPSITEFIKLNGVHGIDGLFLSAMSAAIKIAPLNFDAALMVARSIRNQPFARKIAKLDFPILFLDLSGFERKKSVLEREYPVIDSEIKHYLKKRGINIDDLLGKPFVPIEAPHRKKGEKDVFKTIIDLETGKTIIEKKENPFNVTETGLDGDRDGKINRYAENRTNRNNLLIFSLFSDEARNSFFGFESVEGVEVGENGRPVIHPLMPRANSRTNNFGSEIRKTGRGEQPVNPRLNDWVMAQGSSEARTPGQDVTRTIVTLVALTNPLTPLYLGARAFSTNQPMSWNFTRESLNVLGDATYNFMSGLSVKVGITTDNARIEVEANTNENTPPVIEADTGGSSTESEVEESPIGDTENPDEETTYPVPDADIDIDLKFEDAIVQLAANYISTGGGKIIPKGLILPKTEDAGPGMLLIQDMPLNNFDPYIYPDPLKENYPLMSDLTEEDVQLVIQDIRNHLINPSPTT